MSHFAGGNLPPSFGVAAQLDTLAKAFGTHASSTVVTSTEGTDMLTYTAPVSGFYRIASCLRVTTANNGGTSATLVANMAFTNGSQGGASVITATPIKPLGGTGVTVGTLNAQGTAYSSHLFQDAVIYAYAGTTIQLTVSEIAGGTANSAGKYDIHFLVAGMTQG